jgi:hypothetical protein
MVAQIKTMPGTAATAPRTEKKETAKVKQTFCAIKSKRRWMMLYKSFIVP